MCQVLVSQSFLTLRKQISPLHFEISMTYLELINVIFLLYFAMDNILITEIFLVASVIFFLQRIKKTVLKVQIDRETCFNKILVVVATSVS